MPYAWIIDEGRRPHGAGGVNGVTGPHNAPADLLGRLQAGDGTRFRLTDGDGDPLYYGRILAGMGDDMEFQPLDDFGRGVGGCTGIQYNRFGVWQDL